MSSRFLLFEDFVSVEVVGNKWRKYKVADTILFMPGLSAIVDFKFALFISLPLKQVQPLAGAAAKFPTRVQPSLLLLAVGRQRCWKGGILKTKVRGGATRILSARAKVSLRDLYRPFAPTFPVECWCRAARGSVCLLGSTAASAHISQTAHPERAFATMAKINFGSPPHI